VRNLGQVWAVGLRLRTDEPGILTWSDAYFTLPPGSSANVAVTGDFSRPVKVIAEALNAPPAEILLI
jgi:hypothetical protein